MTEIITYGPGGSDDTKPHGNVVERRLATGGDVATADAAALADLPTRLAGALDALGPLAGDAEKLRAAVLGEITAT